MKLGVFVIEFFKCFVECGISFGVICLFCIFDIYFNYEYFFVVLIWMVKKMVKIDLEVFGILCDLVMSVKVVE